MADVEAGALPVENVDNIFPFDQAEKSLPGSSEQVPVIVWDKRKSKKVDVITEPAATEATPSNTNPNVVFENDEALREFARRSLANARDPPPLPQKPSRYSARSPMDNITAVAVASPDDPSEDASAPAEVYFVDASTGKAMVTKSTTHKGRPASVTVEVGPQGQVLQIVGGTAQLPGESRRQYFRKMSSFAIWQLQESPGTPGIRWEGDQKYAYFSYLIIFVTGVILIAEIAVNNGEFPIGQVPYID